MVLDSAISQSPDVFTESSNFDSPADGPGTEDGLPEGYVIDPRRLPRPIPILGLIAGHDDEWMRNKAREQLQYVSKIVKRPLNAEQCDAMTYNFYKSRATMAWGLPVGVTVGIYRAYSTRNNFRFPFYKPGPNFNMNKFLTLAGPQANLAWRATSVLAYSLLGGFVGKRLFEGYATSVLTVSLFRDPRMAELRQDMVKIGREQEQQRTSERPSPQARNAGVNGVEDYGGVVPEVGGQSQEGVPQAVRQPQSMPRWQPSGRTSASRQVLTRDDKGVFDFDDASPTSGAGMAPEHRPNETAWEHLRHSNAPMSSSRGASTSASSQSAQSPATGDAWASVRRIGGSQMPDATSESFNTHTSESERQQAQRRAQQEFDERLERERRGESFDGPSRWK